MKRHVRCLLWLTGGAFALVLAGCGSDATADAGSEAISAETTAESAATAAGQEPEVDDADDEPGVDEEIEEDAGEVVEATEGAVEVAEFTGDALSLSGQTTAWVPGCNVGSPVTAGEGDCESVGGFTILPVTFTSELSGTLDGSYTQHARYAVSPDGSYVFASIDSFVGIVGECGEGTIVFNSAGSGTFDMTEPLTETPRPVDATWISYTSVESRLSTLGAVLSSTSTETGATSFDTTGTINCGDSEAAGDLVLAARPESGVDPAGALDAAGTATFSVNADCIVVLGGGSPRSCASATEDLYVQGLNNSLVFDGALQGDVRFIAANLVDATDNWEHSGLVIFEGTIDGCGEGAAVYVNEAAGNNRQAGFFHVRSFTPQGFDSGPLGLSIDTSTSISGLARASSEGSYSCG